MKDAPAQMGRGAWCQLGGDARASITIVIRMHHLATRGIPPQRAALLAALAFGDPT